VKNGTKKRNCSSDSNILASDDENKELSTDKALQETNADTRNESAAKGKEHLVAVQTPK